MRARRYSRYELLHDPLSEMLNTVLSLGASRVARVPLVPSYAFPIRYPPGGNIEWHIDQKDNEVSLSVQIEITPSGASWPLLFIDYNYSALPGVAPPKEIEISEWNLQNAVHVRAQNNEGVLYRGQELVHYRPPLPAGHELMQVVFAWRIPNEVACNAGGS